MQNLILLKKIVSNFLINKWTGYVLSRFYDRTIPFRGTKITIPASVSSTTCAMLFWRSYESAEIRFVNKYLDPKLDVLEIGSSLGGVSCQIGKKLSPRTKLICVEANPSLIPALKHNLLMNRIDAQVVNKAIGSGSSINFTTFESNLTGHNSNINDSSGIQSYSIETIALETLIQQFSLVDLNLVCDIEGAEIVILKESASALKLVKNIIIELHQTWYEGHSYSINDMASMIVDLDFQIVDSYGNVYVFSR